MRGGGGTTFKHGRTWMRICTKCRKTKRLRTQFYKAKIPPQGGFAAGYHYYCKECEKQRGLEWRRRRQADPEYKRRLAAKAKREAEAKPELRRAVERRYRAKLYADPKRHTRYLEERRIERYLLKEKRGTMVTKSQPAKMGNYEEHMLPAKPLYLVAKRYVEGYVADGGTVVEACKILGTTDREYRRWLNMEQTRVRWETADRLLTNLGLHWWDVWSEEEVPEKIAA